MKKYCGWIILAGVLSGAVFKDPCSAPLFGIIISIVIWIPLFFLLRWFFSTAFNFKTKNIHTIALYLTIIVIILSHWIIFQMPGWLRFRIYIANPPPPSVKNIHARWLRGLFDVPSYIKFKINKADLDKIITENGYERYEFDQYEKEDFSNDGWFNIEDIDKTDVYCLEKQQEERHTTEYIIYDSNSEQAFHLLYLME